MNLNRIYSVMYRPIRCSLNSDFLKMADVGYTYMYENLKW